MITIDEIDALTGGRIGIHDVPCPLCGPDKRTRAKQDKIVLRVWRIDEGFASFKCARCGVRGHSRDPSATRPDPEVLARIRREAEERDRQSAAEKHRRAAYLWSISRPITGTIAERRYLREARGITLPALPPTLRFLPAKGDYPPALIAAFAIPPEPEPGVLGIPRNVNSIHIIRLLPDGSDRERDEDAKITLGRRLSRPIVLAPINDLLGLVICEGVEDALSAACAGVGAWAAAGAKSMPNLAQTVPNYVDCVTIVADADEDGQKGARELAELIARRGIRVRVEGL